MKGQTHMDMTCMPEFGNSSLRIWFLFFFNGVVIHSILKEKTWWTTHHSFGQMTRNLSVIFFDHPGWL